ncbi:hypothetical protein AOLI_G00026420 [Acnodon oligacanthus]
MPSGELQSFLPPSSVSSSEQPPSASANGALAAASGQPFPMYCQAGWVCGGVIGLEFPMYHKVCADTPNISGAHYSKHSQQMMRTISIS